jgi:cytochrome P450
MGEDTASANGAALRFSTLPMAENRTDAYRAVRAAGPIARGIAGGYVLTSSEYVEYALKNPRLSFSHFSAHGAQQHGSHECVLNPAGRPSEEMIRVGAELFEYLVGHIEQRRGQADTDDLLSTTQAANCR